MILVGLGFFLICCNALAIETNAFALPVDTQRTKVENTLEKFKDIIKHGNNTLGIPALDPLKVEQVPINLDEEDFIKLEALLTDVYSRGLSEYTVISGDFKLIGMKFLMSLSWPLVHAKTNYAMKGKVSDFPIYGNGDMKMDAKEFAFSAELSFTMEGGRLKVKSISSKMSLKELDFKATGLFDDPEVSELLSALISDMIPGMINDSPEMITEYLHPMMTDMINDFLKDKSLSDIIKWLG